MLSFLLQLRIVYMDLGSSILLDDLFGADERENPFEQIKELPEVDAPQTTDY